MYTDAHYNYVFKKAGKGEGTGSAWSPINRGPPLCEAGPCTGEPNTDICFASSNVFTRIQGEMDMEQHVLFKVETTPQNTEHFLYQGGIPQQIIDTMN